jgi:mRNA-degrading endonuclease YafQ of YafQ-DinJ toxin-antitoxin module
MKIEYSSKFVRNFKKLPLEIQTKAIQQERVFKSDIFSLGLKTHKLKGNLKDCFSFSVDYSNRIVFIINENDCVVFLDIGDHSIYK